MLNELFEYNYVRIRQAAKNIVRKSGQEADQLINETFLNIAEKKDYPKDKDIFFYYYLKFMRYMNIGERSQYSKCLDSKHLEIKIDPSDDSWESIEMGAEQINEETKDLLLNLTHLNKDKAVRYAKVMEVKETLAPHEAEIYDLHFDKGLSSRKIAELLETESGWKTSYVRINEFINQVKGKFND